MNKATIRRAFGIIRAHDPGAWRCDYCGRWTDRDVCLNHRFRVLRAPAGPPPPPTPMGYHTWADVKRDMRERMTPDERVVFDAEVVRARAEIVAAERDGA